VGLEEDNLTFVAFYHALIIVASGGGGQPLSSAATIFFSVSASPMASTLRV
jgi:hypothetical protein